MWLIFGQRLTKKTLKSRSTFQAFLAARHTHTCSGRSQAKRNRAQRLRLQSCATFRLWIPKAVQRSALCGSRRELIYLAKFGFDTAENEPCQSLPDRAVQLARVPPSAAANPAGLRALRGLHPPAAPRSAPRPARTAVLMGVGDALAKLATEDSNVKGKPQRTVHRCCSLRGYGLHLREKQFQTT